MLPTPTDSFRRVLDDAEREARASNHEFVGGGSLLMAVLGCGDATLRRLLERHAIDAPGVCRRLREGLASGDGPPVDVSGRLPMAASAQAVVNRAIDLARGLGEPHVSARLLLLAEIEAPDGRAAPLLRDAGADLDLLARDLRERPA